MWRRARRTAGDHETQEEATRELHHEVEVFYPYLIRYYQDRYKVAEAHLNDGGETSIKATVLKHRPWLAMLLPDDEVLGNQPDMAT